MKDDVARLGLSLVSHRSLARQLWVGSCSIALLITTASCKSPSKANIELRKQNEALREEIAGLKRRQTADAATIAALQQSGATVEQLPKPRLDELFTVAGIKLDKLTGGYDSDPQHPGDEAIRVQVTPFDVSGDELKAAGSFRIEAFEKTTSVEPRKLGQWDFDMAQSRSAWLGQMMQYGYLFTCPLPQKPSADELTIKVTFVDALTARELSAERTVTVQR